MRAALDRLKASVQKNKDAGASFRELAAGWATELRAHAGEKDVVTEIANDIDGQVAVWQAAITDNTPTPPLPV